MKLLITKKKAGLGVINLILWLATMSLLISTGPHFITLLLFVILLSGLAIYVVNSESATWTKAKPPKRDLIW
jgi:hypothetical protein